MGGGYLVTGFGSTYFGGNRNPGPFNVDDEKNKVWEDQIQHIPTLFTGLPWWKLQPADSMIMAPVARGSDRQLKRLRGKGPKMRRIQAPPESTYWALANPGSHYLAYVRGVTDEIILDVTVKNAEGQNAEDRDAKTKNLEPFQIRQFNPRTGQLTDLGKHDGSNTIRYTPPSSEDWVLLVTRTATCSEE